MFTKLEMVGAIAISLFGGFAIGYSLFASNHHCYRRAEGTRDDREGGDALNRGSPLFAQTTAPFMEESIFERRSNNEHGKVQKVCGGP